MDDVESTTVFDIKDYINSYTEYQPQYTHNSNQSSHHSTTSPSSSILSTYSDNVFLDEDSDQLEKPTFTSTTDLTDVTDTLSSTLKDLTISILATVDRIKTINDNIRIFSCKTKNVTMDEYKTKDITQTPKSHTSYVIKEYVTSFFIIKKLTNSFYFFL